MDNCATHKHAAVKERLAANPRVTFHNIATHAFWMNMVEMFYGIAERQAV